jgi:crossover junction endodeoxyribonuclease RuvC
VILGLDVATRCGWAYGDGSARPTFGHYEGEKCGDDLGPYFRAFRNWLHGMVTRLKALAESWGQTLRVIFESPVFPKPFLKTAPGRKPMIVQHASIKDRRRLYGLVSIVELVCGDLGVLCYEEPVQALKQALTGKGNAEKEDMVRAAKKMGCEVQVHDEADAIAAWLIGVRIYHRQHLHQWDALLYGRGAGALL